MWLRQRSCQPSKHIMNALKHTEEPGEEPMAPAPRKKPFRVAGQEDRLYSLAADGSRNELDPTLVRGRYWRIRLGLALPLLALFVGAPHVFVAGKPLFLFDLAHRQFTLFGATFHPTENLILLAFGATIIISLFAITTLFGRLWCGYVCPHPVYLEFVYRPLESLFEGKPAARRRLKRAPWSGSKVLRKGGKWATFAAISLFLSGTFVSYFVGWDYLWRALLTAPLDNTGALFATTLTTAAMFFNFNSFRDQMCTVACPYGRLQTVLYDQDTIIVGYDDKRGEPRGARRKGREDELGDCVDCGMCVRTCPTGMDIRRGLQMECIGCAQCVEACDQVMARVSKPAGLIRYTSQREMATGESRFLRPRVALYGVVFSLALGALLTLTVGRDAAAAEILRNGREPYRLVGTGQVANMLRLRLTNRLNKDQTFTVKLAQPAGAKLVVSQSPFQVRADKVGTVNIVAVLPQEVFNKGQAQGLFVIESDGGLVMEQRFMLLGPYN